MCLVRPPGGARGDLPATGVGLWVRNLRRLLYAESYLRRSEDGDCRDDKVQREDPEAQPVDHHRRELPVVRFLGVVVLVLDLARDEAQLVEDGQQFAADAAGQVRSHAGAAARRPARRCPAAADGDAVSVVQDVAHLGVGRRGGVLERRIAGVTTRNGVQRYVHSRIAATSDTTKYNNVLQVLKSNH